MNIDNLEGFLGLQNRDVAETPLNSADTLVTLLLGLDRQNAELKISLVRIVHKDHSDMDLYSYAVLMPYGMNEVWLVFPVLSHSGTSMPEAKLQPYLEHLKDRLDLREATVDSSEEFRDWLKTRDQYFRQVGFGKRL